MFGPCRVCLEKDKRSQSLEAEIAFLRQLVRPDVPKNAYRPDATQLEADALFSGQTNEIIIDEQSRFLERSSTRLSSEDEAAAIEREMLLSGEYSHPTN